MDRKGQVSVGMVVILGIAAIVGLILFQAAAQETGKSLPGLVTANNVTYTFPAAGSKLIITGQELVGTILVMNSTDGSVVPATNYTVAEEVRTTDGYKGIVVTAKAGYYNSKSVNISYQYYPDGYIDDSGGRGVMGIVVVLAAIAVALIILGGIKWGDWGF